MSTPFLDRAAIFCARYLILVLIIETGLYLYQFSAGYLLPTFGVAVVIAWVLALVLQLTIRRKRPFQKTGTPPLMKMWKETPSFPSAHTAISFAIVGVMLFAAGDMRVAAILAVLGAIVGWSRVYVRVHYPSDIVAGGILGLLSAYAAMAVGPMIW